MRQFDIDDFHKTNDMSLVTFLKLKGHAPQDIGWSGGTCFWVFRVSDSFLDLLDDFNEGKALVEPREYNKTFATTKKEFYDHPDRPSRR